MNKKNKISTRVLFFLKFGKNFQIETKFFLKCGSATSHYKIKDNIKILNGNSRDYNMFLKTKNKFLEEI